MAEVDIHGLVRKIVREVVDAVLDDVGYPVGYILTDTTNNTITEVSEKIISSLDKAGYSRHPTYVFNNTGDVHIGSVKEKSDPPKDRDQLQLWVEGRIRTVISNSVLNNNYDDVPDYAKEIIYYLTSSQDSK